MSITADGSPRSVDYTPWRRRLLRRRVLCIATELRICSDSPIIMIHQSKGKLRRWLTKTLIPVTRTAKGCTKVCKRFRPQPSRSSPVRINAEISYKSKNFGIWQAGCTRPQTTIKLKPVQLSHFFML